MMSKSRVRYVDAYLTNLKCKLLQERRDESKCDTRIGSDLIALRRMAMDASRGQAGECEGRESEIKLTLIDPQAYATPDALRLVDQLLTAFRNLVSPLTSQTASHYN